MNDVEFPDITVQFSYQEGNVFSIIAKVVRALKRGGYQEAAEAYRVAADDCESYDAVLQLTMRTVNVT